MVADFLKHTFYVSAPIWFWLLSIGSLLFIAIYAYIRGRIDGRDEAEQDHFENYF